MVVKVIQMKLPGYISDNTVDCFTKGSVRVDAMSIA